MVHQYPGKFVMIDGLDGVGKGVVLDALKMWAISKGKIAKDLNDFWRNSHFYPEYEYFQNADVLISHEPTYGGVGKAIRDELISKGKTYPALSVANAYSLDRQISYTKYIIPALKASKLVIQGRGISTSIAYQPLQAEMFQNQMLDLYSIMALEGNKLALENTPNLLIIMTVKDPEEVMKRLEKRQKNDKAIFEEIDFQKKLKDRYESKWLKEIFESRGTAVEYLDAGISVEESRRQAIELIEKHIQL